MKNLTKYFWDKKVICSEPLKHILVLIFLKFDEKFDKKFLGQKGHLFRIPKTHFGFNIFEIWWKIWQKISGTKRSFVQNPYNTFWFKYFLKFAGNNSDQKKNVGSELKADQIWCYLIFWRGATTNQHMSKQTTAQAHGHHSDQISRSAAWVAQLQEFIKINVYNF